MYAGTGYFGIALTSPSPPPLALGDILGRIPKFDISKAFSNSKLPTFSDSTSKNQIQLVQEPIIKEKSCQPNSVEIIQTVRGPPLVSIDIPNAKLDLHSFQNDGLITYNLRVNFNGRSYIAKRKHCEITKLIKKLDKLGYSFPFQVPKAEPLICWSASFNSRDLIDKCTCPVYVADFEGWTESDSQASHSSSCPCSSSTSNGNSYCNYDMIEDSRFKMEKFFQSLLTCNEEILFLRDLQTFLWEPQTPKGSLDPISEESEDEMEFGV